MTATPDPYLLRLLLWCSPCDLRMECGSASRYDREQDVVVPVRTYRCGMNCRLELVPAEAIESLVWTAAERRATVSDIRPPYRQSVLEMLLVKAVVGPTVADITYIWRT